MKLFLTVLFFAYSFLGFTQLKEGDYCQHCGGISFGGLEILPENRFEIDYIKRGKSNIGKGIYFISRNKLILKFGEISSEKIEISNIEESQIGLRRISFEILENIKLDTLHGCVVLIKDMLGQVYQDYSFAYGRDRTFIVLPDSIKISGVSIFYTGANNLEFSLEGQGDIHVKAIVEWEHAKKYSSGETKIFRIKKITDSALYLKDLDNHKSVVFGTTKKKERRYSRAMRMFYIKNRISNIFWSL